MTALETVCAIELRHITKRFGSVVANDGIDLTINYGEILSLLGENGSGKTTLMNMLAGIYFPDDGEILIGGKPVSIRSPKDAFDNKIGMIHQHYKLIDVFTAAENIVLGLHEGQKLDMAATNKRVQEICDRYGFDIDPTQKIYDMSVSQKQTVEIVKVLYRGADVLILDEPTAVLTPQETDKLFQVLRNMRADGKAIIIITHKLHEVMALSDKVAVLRKGKYIGTVNTAETNPQALTDMMVGRAVALNIDRPRYENPVPRLAERGVMEPWKAWCIRVGSILVALLLGGLVMSIALPEGSNIFSAYGTIIEGALGKKTAIRQTIKLAVPLLGTALAIAPCFKMRFWNIGAEGQITAGAMAASYFALYCYDKMSSPVLLIVMGVSAALLGGIWAFIPGFFKAKWNTNETLFTLMMNYIMIGIVRWLKGGPWEGRPGSQIIPNFDKAAVLPKVFGVHCGWIIVLVLVVFMHIYMKYTKHGYEIAVIGDSVNTARYAGMNVGRIMMRTMFLSGAICGLVGFMVASGANMTLSDTVAAGNGFTAITVAWLSQLNAFAMIVISLMLAILSKGAETLQTRLMVPTSISDIITGILLFCMLGCEFFINYQIIFRGKSSAKEGAKV